MWETGNRVWEGVLRKEGKGGRRGYKSLSGENWAGEGLRKGMGDRKRGKGGVVRNGGGGCSRGRKGVGEEVDSST